ncbi:MAG: nuclear transport factor 2 family protein [Rhodospirillaceae bacterium]|nr:MAG: nuclear transport factor 2 family protein [Rhodospirillaceae bacterium]
MSALGDEILKRGFEGFQSKALERHVQELADREEIKELTARYAHRISRGQSVADMFTDDAAFIIRVPGKPVQEVRGREQIDKFYGAIVSDPKPTLPTIHNHVIAISADEATELCWLEVRTMDGNVLSSAGSGCYEDRLRRENGRWKFVVREITMTGQM